MDLGTGLKKPNLSLQFINPNYDEVICCVVQKLSCHLRLHDMPFKARTEQCNIQLIFLLFIIEKDQNN